MVEETHHLPPLKEHGKFCKAPERQFGSDLMATNLRNGFTLVVYNYYESEGSIDNLAFFLEHGLHDRQDTHFLFVLSQSPCITFPSAPNIAITYDSNGCYGFGAIKRSMDTFPSVFKYKKFVFLGSWVQGPFMPTWSSACWTDAFTALLDEHHHVSGTTMGCAPNEDGYHNKRPFLHLTAWAALSDALVPLLSHFDCHPQHASDFKRTQVTQYRTLQDRNLGVAVLSSTYEIDALNMCRYEWPFHAHPYDAIFVNPRLSRTLKESKFVDTQSLKEMREFHFLKSSTTGTEVPNYDSRKYCRNT